MRFLLHCVLVLAVLSVLLSAPTTALCTKASKKHHVLYATTSSIQDIESYDHKGNYLGGVINNASLPEAFVASNLRGMQFGPDGLLYVASTGIHYGRVFTLSGAVNDDCTRDFVSTAVEQTPVNPYMSSPYAVVFHPETKAMYVSNEQSATVTVYTYDDVNNTWTPAKNKNHAISAFPNMVMSDAGIYVSRWSTSYTLQSVAGIALSPRAPVAMVEGDNGDYKAPDSSSDSTMPTAHYLVVCDTLANQVLVFRDNGHYLYSISVPEPVQVQFNEFSSLDPGNPNLFAYVTSNKKGQVFLIRLTNDNNVNTVINRDSKYSAMAGMVQHTKKNQIIVADSLRQSIEVYGVMPRQSYHTYSIVKYFVEKMTMSPQFLLWTKLEFSKTNTTMSPVNFTISAL